MKAIIKLLAILALTLGALAGTAPAAFAAAPANDTFAGATLATIGFSEVLDTAQATFDSDDVQLLESCGLPIDLRPSVWYAFDGTDTQVVVDASASNYPAGVLVGVGSQGNLQSVRCGAPGYADFFAAAGTRYYVLVTGGGLLSISFYNWDNVPRPTLEITVDRFGRVDPKTGNAAMSGTYMCTHSSNITISVFARENVDSLYNETGEFFGFGLSCDGAVHTWTAHINPQNNNFVAGSTAITEIYASACSPFECATSGRVEQTVKWRGGLKVSPFG